MEKKLSKGDLVSIFIRSNFLQLRAYAGNRLLRVAYPGTQKALQR